MWAPCHAWRAATSAYGKLCLLLSVAPLRDERFDAEPWLGQSGFIRKTAILGRPSFSRMSTSSVERQRRARRGDAEREQSAREG